MSLAVLYDERIPLEIRTLAQTRLDDFHSLGGSRHQLPKQLRRRALLIALEANPNLTLWKGELSLILNVDKDRPLTTRVTDKFNVFAES